jgi:hypothetical protein
MSIFTRIQGFSIKFVAKIEPDWVRSLDYRCRVIWFAVKLISLWQFFFLYLCSTNTWSGVIRPGRLRAREFGERGYKECWGLGAWTRDLFGEVRTLKLFEPRCFLKHCNLSLCEVVGKQMALLSKDTFCELSIVLAWPYYHMQFNHISI